MRRSITRRKLIQGTALAAGAAVFGPWKFNRVYAASSDKPIRIGLSEDAAKTRLNFQGPKTAAPAVSAVP